MVDIEPLLVLALNITSYPLHGYLHTFISSLVMGSLLGYIMYKMDKVFRPFFERLALVDKSVDNLRDYIVAGITGWAIHVALDSPLYSDIRPLYPLQHNPLYNSILQKVPSPLCSILLLIGIAIYIVHLYRTSSERVGRLPARMQTGLTSLILGIISLTLILANPFFEILSLLLIAIGIVLFHMSLMKLAMKWKNRIMYSLISMLASLFLFTSIMRGLVLTIYVAWFMALTGLFLIRSPLKSLTRGANDKLLKNAVDLLIAGWSLTPIIVGIPIVLIVLAVMVVKIPVNVILPHNNVK